jgi:AraC-like DNA-binding protein
MAVAAALRGGAIALLLLYAAMMWRDRRHVAAGRYAVLLAMCGVAYLIEQAPEFAHECPRWIIPIRLFSIGGPGLFFLWAAAQFDDDFVPNWRWWLPWFGMVALGGWGIATDSAIAWRSVRMAALALVALGIWQALAGRNDDLIEGRRRVRLGVALGAGLFIVGCSQFGDLVGGAAPAALAALVFASFWLSLRAVGRPDQPVPAEVAPRVRPTAAPDPEASGLLARLEHLMEHERIYREDDFGVVALAGRLGVPEYRLRRLINQRLGHRNFTSFVNGYRLAEAAAALADPGQAPVPVLTIALDAGFQSIGPFNRAFKAHFGTTPSEYRRDHMGGSQARAAE